MRESDRPEKTGRRASYGTPRRYGIRPLRRKRGHLLMAASSPAIFPVSAAPKEEGCKGMGVTVRIPLCPSMRGWPSSYEASCRRPRQTTRRKQPERCNVYSATTFSSRQRGEGSWGSSGGALYASAPVYPPKTPSVPGYA